MHLNEGTRNCFHIHEIIAEAKVQMQLPRFEVCAKNSRSWLIIGQKN